MEWNERECRVLYAEALEYLKNSLGITQLDADLSHTCLLPYQVVIIKYLNRELIQLGTDSIKAKIERVLEIFKEGECRIVEDMEPRKFAEEIRCDIESENFHCCRFVFAWTNLLTALCIRLKFQYAYLFSQEYDGKCCKCGTRGQTTKDYESWVSNVFPEDELFDRSNYERANSAWEVSKDRYCDCYRHGDSDVDVPDKPNTGGECNPGGDNTVKEYAIVRFMSNNILLQELSVPVGTLPIYTGSIPEKDSEYDAETNIGYRYFFAGWEEESDDQDNEISDQFVNGDLQFGIKVCTEKTTYIYNALFYREEYYKYATVNFVVEGEVVQTSEVRLGELPVYIGNLPEKEEDDNFTYTFVGWDPEIVVVSEEGNITYTASFIPVEKEKFIHLVFKDYSDNVLFETDIQQEEEYDPIDIYVPTFDDYYDSETNEGYEYIFTGWSLISQESNTITYQALVQTKHFKKLTKLIRVNGLDEQGANPDNDLSSDKEYIFVTYNGITSVTDDNDQVKNYLNILFNTDIKSTSKGLVFNTASAVLNEDITAQINDSVSSIENSYNIFSNLTEFFVSEESFSTGVKSQNSETGEEETQLVPIPMEWLRSRSNPEQSSVFELLVGEEANDNLKRIAAISKNGFDLVEVTIDSDFTKSTNWQYDSNDDLCVYNSLTNRVFAYNVSSPRIAPYLSTTVSIKASYHIPLLFYKKENEKYYFNDEVITRSLFSARRLTTPIASHFVYIEASDTEEGSTEL